MLFKKNLFILILIDYNFIFYKSENLLKIINFTKIKNTIYILK